VCNLKDLVQAVGLRRLSDIGATAQKFVSDEAGPGFGGGGLLGG